MTTRQSFLAVGLVSLLSLSAVPVSAQSLDEAEEALRRGDYEDASKAFARLADERVSARIYRGWVDSLRIVGRYDEAAERAREFGEQTGAAHLSNRLGEILYETGRIEEARRTFERSVAEKAPDALVAELNLALLLYHEGQTDAALKRFDRFIDAYNQSSSLSAEELEAIGVACRYLGVTDPQLYKDALRAFDEAAKAGQGRLMPRILAGELFLEKYNSTDAGESFQQVLAVNERHPRALVGMAGVRIFDGGAEATALIEKALEVNPNYVPARTMLARQHLSLEDYREAREHAEKALETNPVSLDALTILAAAEFLAGRHEAFEELSARVFARNPRYADFYNTLSDIAVQNRLYREAREFAAEATRLDESSWKGYGLLGLNQLRLGDIETGWKNLERAFTGDPYNVWIKNTLDLLDTFPGYRTTNTERFEIFVEGTESDLLSLYVGRVADEAYERLAELYQYRPPTPIRIEVFPSHADFSVRTIGLAGLGALGVCFGPVVVIDSPSARPRGQFNWASTLWHELAHTVTLGVTDHKVPRWFSEGLSVLEERRARPGWGDDVNLPFLIAYKQDKLLPIAELNNGFIRPSYPQQIGISYYQASLVSELIERDHGFQAIRDMLAGYRQGLETEQVFRNVLNQELEDFDADFAAFLTERFGRITSLLRLPDEGMVLSLTDLVERAQDEDDILAQLKMGEQLFKQDKLDEAEIYLKRARDLFPEYGGDDSPYWYLGQIYQKRGDSAKAAEALARFVDINENHYEAHVGLADIYLELGKSREAVEILERAVFIYPFEVADHQKLAELYRELGSSQAMIQERRALVGLTAVDEVQARYELAVAYDEAGDRDSARKELLRALELAPTFREGLALLLKLKRESGGGL